MSIIKAIITRCRVYTFPGDWGYLHIHTKRWSHKVTEVIYEPANATMAYRVPDDKWEAFVTSTSHLEAMAYVRGLK